MKKLKDFYGAHPIRWTILLIVIVAAASALIYYAPSFGLKAEPVPAVAVAHEALGKAIPVSGEIVVAQEGGRTLKLDTEELIFTLVDDATGKTWSSAIPGNSNGEYKALLKITYLGEDNTFTDWNTYDNCVAFGTYGLFQLDNGVRIQMDVNEGESNRFFEYLPQKIPIARYEEFMIPTLEQKILDGDISQEDGDRFRRAVTMMYRKNEKENCYALTTTGTPSVSATNQLIAFVNAIGYTRDMLIEDCAAFDTVPDFKEPAQFDIVLEARLENGDLVVRVPGDEIATGNDFYRLQRMAVLPNFGGAAYDKEGDGFFLVPDGAGALMRFNTYTATVPEYVRPYLDNDFYTDYFYMSEYAEELMTPVFGALYGGETPTHGMMGIIEKGVPVANLHVSLAGTNGTGMNRAYVSFDTLEYDRVKIYGEYADNGATYLSDSGMIVEDYTIRYRPYATGVTYFDLAMDYRDYLAAKAGREAAAIDGPGAYLEVLGAVTLRDRFLGIPYDRTTSMTTYADLKAILDELPGEGVAVQYDGAFNGGMINSLNDGARLVKQNGSKNDLTALKNAAAQKGIDLFWQVNLSRVYKNGRTYRPGAHALRDFSNEAATFYPYSPAAEGILNGHYDAIHPYTRISPRYLGYVTDRFLAEAEEFDGLAIGDLARDVYVDYRYRQVIDPVEARQIVTENLEKLASHTLSLHDPAADLAPLGKYAVDVSRRSSEYTSFYATVPFRQLALSGLTQLVSEDVNLHSRSIGYYLTQAAEMGTSVKYTVTAQNADVFKSSHFESIYAADWDEWKDEILSAAEELAEIRSVIGGQTIVGHRMLAVDVFETTWSNGARTLVNYSGKPYESEEGTVEPDGYLLVREGGAQ